jgi:polyphenol oxidase
LTSLCGFISSSANGFVTGILKTANSCFNEGRSPKIPEAAEPALTSQRDPAKRDAVNAIMIPQLKLLKGSADWVLHGFTLRVPGVDVATDRATALERLEGYYRELLKHESAAPLRLVEQVHGNQVVRVDDQSIEKSPGADALITNHTDVTLGIYVADCCAIYLLDPVRRAIGLAHSGRKGTELNIAAATLSLMQKEFDSNPEEMQAILGPCIRPPHYDIDFATTIRTQLQQTGIRMIEDSGENTGADLTRFYSYRMEKGKTGRMLAYLGLR